MRKARRCTLFAMALAIGFVGVRQAAAVAPTDDELAWFSRDEGGAVSAERAAAIAQAIDAFRFDNPMTELYTVGRQITKIYGKAFAFGDSAEASAEQFIQQHAGMFGVTLDQLDPRGALADERHTQPVYYVADTQSYRFTQVYYTQRVGGIPVYGAELRLLVRNEPNFPLVLATSTLRDLGTFQARADAANVRFDRAQRKALRAHPGLVNFTQPETVIWAGYEKVVANQPVLAIVFHADNGLPINELPVARRIIADARTGDILMDENLILHAEVSGTVQGMVTQGIGADICEDEELEGLPYARVDVGGETVFADVNGNYSADVPAGPVSVNSQVRGQFFIMDDNTGNSVLNVDTNAPDVVDFVHNAANADEFDRAEVNSYVEANVVRDMALGANPAYPVIPGQSNFPINANIALNCNAFYFNSTINFYTSGGGCSNTANTTIVHHEYGHHLVAVGGSGQGAYGEGCSDVMAVVVSDTNLLALGWNNCAAPLRNADNDCQYDPNTCTTNCGGPNHPCGRLYSGCVWDTRNELVVTEPADYLTILRNLSVNSILLHTGTSITPQITIDWLTLDDDDDNIFNGTPHYDEINTGFSAHNMAAPPLALVEFDYPNGLPDLVNPNQPTTVRVDVIAVTNNPVPGTGEVHYSIDGGPFTTVAMNELADNQYEATLPGTGCGTVTNWYVSAQDDQANTVTDPMDAPDDTYQTIAATGTETLVAYDFEVDPGWTVSGDATDGQWDRGVPVDCNRGDPPADQDGSGQCWLTDNSAANGCNSDVDGGATILSSQSIDISGLVNPVVRYARWYSNTVGDSPEADIFTVEVSDNGGASWTEMEVVGPTQNSPNPEVNGGWFVKDYFIGDFVNITNQFRIRYTAFDSPAAGSVIEAGVDRFEIFEYVCQNDNIAVPDDFTVVRGANAQGNVGDLANSDDQRLTVDAGITIQAGEPPVWLTMNATAALENPSGMTLRVESSGNTPQLEQTIELFNYQINDWELMDVRDLGTADSVAEIVLGGDLSRFMDGGAMQAQLTYQPPTLVLVYPWTVRIDQVAWEFSE